MFDHVIKDPDWRAALHGKPLMQVIFEGNVYLICPAKAIHYDGQFAERANSLFNLALMIRHNRSYDNWKNLPYFAVCNSEERELFCIQSPCSDNAVGRCMLENRVLWCLKLMAKGPEAWLKEHGIKPEQINDYLLKICMDID